MGFIRTTADYRCDWCGKEVTIEDAERHPLFWIVTERFAWECMDGPRGTALRSTGADWWCSIPCVIAGLRREEIATYGEIGETPPEDTVEHDDW